MSSTSRSSRAKFIFWTPTWSLLRHNPSVYTKNDCQVLLPEIVDEELLFPRIALAINNPSFFLFQVMWFVIEKKMVQTTQFTRLSKTFRKLLTVFFFWWEPTRKGIFAQIGLKSLESSRFSNQNYQNEKYAVSGNLFFEEKSTLYSAIF